MQSSKNTAEERRCDRIIKLILFRLPEMRDCCPQIQEEIKRKSMNCPRTLLKIKVLENATHKL